MNDCTVIRMVVGGIITFALVGLLLIGWLVNGGKVPEGHIIALVGLVGPAIGSLASMLSSTRSAGGGPVQDVTVVNKADNPVPVEEDKK